MQNTCPDCVAEQPGPLRPVARRGLCKTHYNRTRRSGELPRLLALPNQPCTFAGCPHTAVSKGLCQKHYGRLRRNGSPGVLRNPDRTTPDGSQRECSKCGVLQPIAEFRIHKQRGYRDAECRTCLNARNKARWQNSPEKQRASIRRYRLKSRFGLTAERYAEVLAAQSDGCAICGQACTSGRMLAVDHDHETGAVRGLLCGRCNLALERLECVAGWAVAAERYLAADRDWRDWPQAM